jgi:molybdopterin converting factor subunit 1
MRIVVKLFAILRDRAGVSELPLELPAGATVAAAADLLLARFPSLHDLFAKSAYAVNCSYARKDAPLTDGDELAVIPPVSGG